MRTNNNSLVVINIPYRLKDCTECPKVRSERTPGTGYALDYYCTAMAGESKVMGYIEWESEHSPVPDWCPYR